MFIVLSISVEPMSSSLTQMLVTALTGLALLVTVVRLSRLRRISFRYAMGWIAIASVGILGSLLIPLTAPLAEELKLSPAALLALIVFIFFLIITLQLSISISGLQQQNRRLAEEVALLRHEIRPPAQRAE